MEYVIHVRKWERYVHRLISNWSFFVNFLLTKLMEKPNIGRYKYIYINILNMISFLININIPKPLLHILLHSQPHSISHNTSIKYIIIVLLFTSFSPLLFFGIANTHVEAKKKKKNITHYNNKYCVVYPKE